MRAFYLLIVLQTIRIRRSIRPPLLSLSMSGFGNMSASVKEDNNKKICFNGKVPI